MGGGGQGYTQAFDGGASGVAGGCWSRVKSSGSIWVRAPSLVHNTSSVVESGVVHFIITPSCPDLSLASSMCLTSMPALVVIWTG